MASQVENNWSSSGLPPEVQALLQELRKNYRRDQSNERKVKSARKRQIIMAGATLSSMVLGFLAFLQISGLLF
jgi:hypothetical protein